MNKVYTIIAIMGKAGSGKDTFLRALLQEPEFKDAAPIVSCTTRPMRENEQNGIDYHFLTNEQFTNQILSGEMLEATVFNNWCYGTSINNLSANKLNIGVFNPEGIEILQDRNDINLIIILIEADDKTRLLRQLNREEYPDCHEIIRRFGTDEIDFSIDRIKDINPDLTITNNNSIDIKTLTRIFANAWAQGQI